MDEAGLIAYIDPGSGTVLLQIILSGFLAALLFLRSRILSLFLFPFRRGPERSADAAADPAPALLEKPPETPAEACIRGTEPAALERPREKACQR